MIFHPRSFLEMSDNFTITESANNQIHHALSDNSDKVFRIEIQGAGCAGFKYVFSLSEREENDVELANNVVSDDFSMIYLDGATLDFNESDVFNKTFTIDNPNVTTTCGCNLSFSI